MKEIVFIKTNQEKLTKTEKTNYLEERKQELECIQQTLENK